MQTETETLYCECCFCLLESSDKVCPACNLEQYLDLPLTNGERHAALKWARMCYLGSISRIELLIYAERLVARRDEYMESFRPTLAQVRRSN